MVKNCNVFLKNKKLNNNNEIESEEEENGKEDEEENEENNEYNGEVEESVVDSDLQYSHVWSENTEDLCKDDMFF